MRTPLIAALVLALQAPACQRTTAPGAAARSRNGVPPGTALALQVLRGPVTPVCRVGVPCDAPFSAQFLVQQGDRNVAQFTTDSSGRATIPLAPGTYTVVPGPGAPIIAPQSQRRTVTVGPGSTTTDTLRFDTGIR